MLSLRLHFGSASCGGDQTQNFYTPSHVLCVYSIRPLPFILRFLFPCVWSSLFNSLPKLPMWLKIMRTSNQLLTHSSYKKTLKHLKIRFRTWEQLFFTSVFTCLLLLLLLLLFILLLPPVDKTLFIGFLQFLVSYLCNGACWNFLPNKYLTIKIIEIVIMLIIIIPQTKVLLDHAILNSYFFN